jgi:hypothetical protein
MSTQPETVSPFFDPRVRAVFEQAFSEDVQRAWPDYTRFTPWLTLDMPSHPVRSGDKEPDIGIFHGVYLVALFPSPDDVPAGPADPFHPSVVYVGRTKSSSLRSRWKQLHASSRGGQGHSGGNTFFKMFIAPDPSHREQVLARTRLAGLPVWLADPTGKLDLRRTAFRTGLLEAVLIEAIHREKCDKGKVGGFPLLNKE